MDVDVIDGDALAGSVARMLVRGLQPQQGLLESPGPVTAHFLQAGPFLPRLTALHRTRAPVFCDYPTFLSSSPHPLPRSFPLLSSWPLPAFPARSL